MTRRVIIDIPDSDSIPLAVRDVRRLRSRRTVAGLLLFASNGPVTWTTVQHVAARNTPSTAVSPADELYRWAPPARYLNQPRQGGLNQ